jgi:diguanylate cyclase (GGDEF)-like protein
MPSEKAPRERNAPDPDQRASDADRAASDADQAASDLDRRDSAADERSAQRDQEASDNELSGEASEGAQRAHTVSRQAREQSSLERHATALRRSQIATERDLQAARRDAEAQERDHRASARDRASEARGRKLLEEMKKLASGGETSREALEAGVQLCSHAARDRAAAAADRERAALDRAEAARERQDLDSALRAAHLDDLTGAYRRGMGEIVLRNELERAQRTTSSLTLAVIDADRLKAINDARGHAAGDAFLRAIASTLRTKLRPYDPLVRTGGDEFVCTIAGSNLSSSRERLAKVSRALMEAEPAVSISVGIAAMAPEDTLETLMARADAALYECKRNIAGEP